VGKSYRMRNYLTDQREDLPADIANGPPPTGRHSDAMISPMTGPRDIEPLWHCGYWDGPTSGVVLFRGTLCWFQWDEELKAGLVDPNREDQPDRVYEIFEMTDSETRDVVTQHMKFERYVGCHTCYGISADGHRDISLQWWDKFGPAPEDSPFYADWRNRLQEPPAVTTEGKDPLARVAGSEFLPGPPNRQAT